MWLVHKLRTIPPAIQIQSNKANCNLFSPSSEYKIAKTYIYFEISWAPCGYFVLFITVNHKMPLLLANFHSIFQVTSISVRQVCLD